MSRPQTYPRTPSDSDAGRSLVPGTRIDHFKIISFLGRGGMGHVYLARDVKLGRKVALKMLGSLRTGERAPLLRFLVEARTTARFSHPNIVTIYSVGEYAGQPYLALEYLSGQTLYERLRNRTLGLQETLRIALAVAEAVTEAHRHDILHLDLKPGNIIITKDGRPKVLDFGLAQNVNAEPDVADSPASSTSDISRRSPLGTPGYLAPEQWKRRPRSKATDVWAFGIMLYEMLEGRRPFAANETSLEELYRAVTSYTSPPHLDQADPSVNDLVNRCLSPSASERPSAEELQSELRKLLHPNLQADQSVKNPFRGLLAFTAQNTNFFFGREQEIAEAVERLTLDPILAVVGASGAGKSSLVQAGIVPRIKEQGRFTVIVMRPGPSPFYALATRILGRHSNGSGLATSTKQAQELADELHHTPDRLAVILNEAAETDQSRVLLVIDQLEELYTLAPEAQASRFMQAIAAAAEIPEDPVRVVFTVRDDFLSRIATGGAKVRSVLRQVMVVQIPEHEALKDILTKPVQALGYRYEDRSLVERMLSSVEARSASLPLLQFAAVMLWQKRDVKRRLLTRSAYDELGGVEGALARHADGVLDKFDSYEKIIAKQILLRLVTPEQTRRVLSYEETLQGLKSNAQTVLDRLVESRLVNTTKDSGGNESSSALELAHESLIQNWRQLCDWLADSRDELRFLAEIEEIAALWEKRGHRIDEVWTGGDLLEALRARQRCTAPVPPRVDRFLSAGRKAERRRRLRRQLLLMGTLVVLLGVSAGLYLGRQEALRQQRVAELGKAVAEREGAASAMIQGRLLEARAKLRTSLQMADALPTRALWWRLSSMPILWRSEMPTKPYDVQFHPTASRSRSARRRGRSTFTTLRPVTAEHSKTASQMAARRLRFRRQGIGWR